MGTALFRFGVRRRLTLTVGLSAMLVLGMSIPASAAVVIAERGLIGMYEVTDSMAAPGAKCGYGRANASGDARLRWIKARPPEVFARDVTTGRDHQRVSWTLIIQRTDGSGPWRNVAAVRQGGLAFDDQPANFKRMGLFVRGREGFSYRAKGIVKWWRNRSVEGGVKYLVEYYAVRRADPPHVFEGSCPGFVDLTPAALR